ncbi:GNAT family N-acetyltransferase [Streptomyces tanashiensis]
MLRRPLHRGRSHRIGYVEGVAVREDLRRQGLGGAVMDGLERVIDGAYAFGALSASDEGAALYRARGWRIWEGRLEALGPGGSSTSPRTRAPSSCAPRTACPCRTPPPRSSSTGGTAT